MSQDKVTKFRPGQEFRLDRKVIFVEYESMIGTLVKCRFDLSQKTEIILDDHKILSFEDLKNLCSKGEELFIKKAEYYEKECHAVVGDKLLILTKVYFENAGYQQAYENNNKLLLRNAMNSTYGIASRDWADVLADSARYIYMQQSRCSGKTLWASSATSFADKQPLWNVSHYHVNCEQRLKEPPGDHQFISDDLEDCEKGVPNTKLTSVKLYFQDTTTGEMKSYEGVKNITPKPRHFRGTTWTHPKSAFGKLGHMLVVDITSKAFLRDDDYLDVEVGDVMLYDDGFDGKAEPDDHGKIFVWQGLWIGWKKLPDANGYFDTDMAMTKEEMQYCRNDVAVTDKLFKEEQIMRFDSCKPTIKNVIFNAPATIVFWSDGTKTVVKCGENDTFDPEKGVAMCCMKKLLGTNKTGSNYLDKVQEYFDKYDEDYIEECKTVGEILSSIFGSSKKSTDIPPDVTVDKEFEAVTSDDWTVATAEENGE